MVSSMLPSTPEVGVLEASVHEKVSSAMTEAVETLKDFQPEDAGLCIIMYRPLSHSSTCVTIRSLVTGDKGEPTIDGKVVSIQEQNTENSSKGCVLLDGEPFTPDGDLGRCKSALHLKKQSPILKELQELESFGTLYYCEPTGSRGSVCLFLTEDKADAWQARQMQDFKSGVKRELSYFSSQTCDSPYLQVRASWDLSDDIDPTRSQTLLIYHSDKYRAVRTGEVIKPEEASLTKYYAIPQSLLDQHKLIGLVLSRVANTFNSSKNRGSFLDDILQKPAGLLAPYEIPSLVGRDYNFTKVIHTGAREQHLPGELKEISPETKNLCILYRNTVNAVNALERELAYLWSWEDRPVLEEMRHLQETVSNTLPTLYEKLDDIKKLNPVVVLTSSCLEFYTDDQRPFPYEQLKNHMLELGKETSNQFYDVEYLQKLVPEAEGKYEGGHFVVCSKEGALGLAALTGWRLYELRYLKEDTILHAILFGDGSGAPQAEAN